MVRYRKVRSYTAEFMQKAIDLIKEGISISKAASKCKVPYNAVRDNWLKIKASLDTYYDVSKVFNTEQEKALNNYYQYCSLLFYGLTVKEARKIAFQMAEAHKLKIPDTWKAKGLAGEDWFRGFRQRHPEISFTKEQPSKITDFNQSNTERFYDNLETAIKRQPEIFADGSRIFNLDEISTSLVNRTAPKTYVEKLTYRHKNVTVTTCCIVNASGHALPPVLVFPRNYSNPEMLNGVPEGSLGLSTPSGFMNAKLFLNVMEHFVTHSNSSKDNPSILIFDNNESHLSIKALDFAKISGVTIVSLYPRLSHRLQPLDVGVFGHLKKFYKMAMDSWLLRNPEIPSSIYEAGTIIGYAFFRALTPSNIKKSFKTTGIYPLDRNISREYLDWPEPILEFTKQNFIVLDNSLTAPQIDTPSCSGTSTAVVSSMLCEAPRKVELVNHSKLGRGVISVDTLDVQTDVLFEYDDDEIIWNENYGPLLSEDINEYLSKVPSEDIAGSKQMKNEESPTHTEREEIVNEAEDTPIDIKIEEIAYDVERPNINIKIEETTNDVDDPLQFKIEEIPCNVVEPPIRIKIEEIENEDPETPIYVKIEENAYEIPELPVNIKIEESAGDVEEPPKYNTIEDIKEAQAISTNERKRKLPHIFGDYEVDDLQCPIKRRTFWNNSEKLFISQKDRIEYLETKANRLQTKVIELVKQLEHLQKSNKFCQNCSSILTVSES